MQLTKYYWKLTRHQHPCVLCGEEEHPAGVCPKFTKKGKLRDFGILAEYHYPVILESAYTAEQKKKEEYEDVRGMRGGHWKQSGVAQQQAGTGDGLWRKLHHEITKVLVSIIA